MDRIICVVGPTASGKTELALRLAEALSGEIVSCDSMQVYRRMDIGTAKPTSDELARARHHMIDVCEPGEDFSAGKYVPMADACVQDILSRGKIAVIVGGTGLYADSLIAGRTFAPVPQTGAREALQARLAREGGEALLRELSQVDPGTAARLHPADEKRIVRALEVYYETGEPISRHNERAAGLEDEVRGLLTSGVPDTATSMQAIGYKELAAALRGEYAVDEAFRLIQQRSRNYAKRQLTWFRRNEKMHWLVRGAGGSDASIFQEALQIIPFFAG